MPILDVTVRVRCEECGTLTDVVLDRARFIAFAETVDDVARNAALESGFFETDPGDWTCYRCYGDDEDED